MKLFYDLNKNKHGKCGNRRRRKDCCKRSIPRIECDEMAMVPIRIIPYIAINFSSIDHQVYSYQLNTFSYDLIFFGIIVSTNSITISSIPEEKIQFPFSPIDPRKNLVFPIRTFNFLLYPKNAAFVWTFHDPQTDLTEQSNEPKTASFLSTFTLTPDYELPKAPARHNHLLDHKLSPLSPCFLPLRLLSTTRNASSSSDRYPEREGWAG